MLIALSIVLWVLLTLLGILVIALFMPICVSVEVNYDKPKAWLKILFFKMQIYPLKDKPKKKKEKVASAEETQNKADNKNSNEKPKAKISFEKIIAIMQSSSLAIKIIFKGLFFTKIQITYPICKEDSAQTAIAYGQAQAYFGGISAAVQNFVNLSFKSVNLIPDFTGEHKYRRYFYCNIWSCAFIIIVAGIYALLRLKKEDII